MSWTQFRCRESFVAYNDFVSFKVPSIDPWLTLNSRNCKFSIACIALYICFLCSPCALAFVLMVLLFLSFGWSTKPPGKHVLGRLAAPCICRFGCWLPWQFGDPSNELHLGHIHETLNLHNFMTLPMWQRGQVLTWNFKAASVSGGFPGFPGPKHPVSTPERAVAAAPREGKAKVKAATPAPQTPQPPAAAPAPAPVEEPIVTPKEEVVGETLKTMHLGFEGMKSFFWKWENEWFLPYTFIFSHFLAKLKWKSQSFVVFVFFKTIEAKSLGDHGPHSPIAGSKACTERGAGFDGWDSPFWQLGDSEPHGVSR